MARKIRVLIVDDSMVFREVLARGLGDDPAIEVAGTACDPYDASDKIIALKPDVLILDVEMPRMNGIEFLRRLMPQYPMPVVMVSSLNNAVFEALQAGAVDFVHKPDSSSSDRSVENFINEVIIKTKIASLARVGPKNSAGIKCRQDTAAHGESRFKLIAMGASTGGTEAIASIIKSLPPAMPGIVVVQHMPPIFTRMYAERLNNLSDWEVREARDGDYIRPGLALIAPGGSQMTVRKASGYIVRCQPGEKVNGHCPSVDVLFNSVAAHCRAEALGVILTGMGSDGARGLLTMRRSGARTIGQDESTSIVYGMPKVAYTTGAVELQAGLDRIPALICSLAAGKK